MLSRCWRSGRRWRGIINAHTYTIQIELSRLLSRRLEAKCNKLRFFDPICRKRTETKATVRSAQRVTARAVQRSHDVAKRAHFSVECDLQIDNLREWHLRLHQSGHNFNLDAVENRSVRNCGKVESRIFVEIRRRRGRIHVHKREGRVAFHHVARIVSRSYHA